MKRAAVPAALLAGLGLLLPGAAQAHSFVEPYTLPVPFWLYLYACAATLVVTFAAIGYFASAPTARRAPRGVDLHAPGRVGAVAARWALRLLRAGAMGCPLLTMVAGLIGTPSPLANISMTLFWIGFLLAGAWLFGKAVWFEHGEVFGVFFRLVGTLAPVAYAPRPGERSCRPRLRLPFSGTLEERPEHLSLVLFVLFMLSSTTYDGVHDTVFWVGLFWKNLLALLQPFWGADMGKAQAMLATWYTLYQRAGLVLSPLLYFAVYMLVMAATRAIARTAIPLRELALQFAFAIIPIAFVYNVTHYFTLILTQLPLLPYIASDPFGFGWNLFGIAPDFTGPAPLDMATIWHTEVALILAGHVVSVCLAHVIALRLFPSRRQAVISQLPMLFLMMAYTIMGLWVLSLPLALH